MSEEAKKAADDALEQARKNETTKQMIQSLRERLARIENSILSNHIRLNNIDTWVFQDQMQEETIGCSQKPFIEAEANKIIKPN